MCQESQKALVKRVHFGTLLKHLDAKPHIMKAKPPPAAAPPAMAIPLLTIEVGSSTCPVFIENKAYAAIRSKLWKSSMNFQRQKTDSFLFWRLLRQRDSLIKLLTFTTVTRYNHVNHVDQGEQEWRLDACVDSPPPVPRTVLASFRDCMMQINPAVP